MRFPFSSTINSVLRLSETKEKILRNLFWSVVGKIVTLLGGLLVGIIVARYLGPEKYGLMNYVISIVTIFMIFSQFGFDLIEIREESKKPHLRDYIIGTVFYLRIALALITLLAIVIYVYTCEGDSYVRLLIMIYSISIILSAFNVARNHFTALVWNEYIVKTEIFRTLVGIALKIILLLYHASLTWFVLALLFDALLLATGYLVSYKKKIDNPLKWRFNSKVARYFIQQSFPLLLSGAAIIVYERIDQVMLGNMLDKTCVGHYSVAVRFVEILIFIPTIIAQTVSPILAKHYQENKQLYKRNAEIFLNITLWMSIIASVILCIISYPVIKLTFGSQYLPAVPILSIMSFKVIGAALAQTSGQLIIIEKRQKWVSLRNIIGCIVCIILNIILIGKYGVIGAAIVSVITIFVSGFITNLIISPYIHIFKMQVSSLIYGWKDIVYVRQLLK